MRAEYTRSRLSRTHGEGGRRAQALFLHPNTVRRIAGRAGRDPYVLADLQELTAAARLLAAGTRARA
jgi:hypothetical protein